MYTDKIEINNQVLNREKIQQKMIEKALPIWEKNVYKFILNWFDESDFIFQLTSGSTGTPKEIKLKKSAMIVSAEKTLEFFHLKQNDSAWLCLPIEYIAGKMMVVRAIVGELNLLLSGPKGVPEIPKQLVDFTAMVPLQLKQLIDKKTDFSKIKTIIAGGAAVDYSLQQKIQKISSTVFATYGMTETCSHIALQKLNGEKPDKYFQVLDGVKISKNKNDCLKIEAPLLTDNTVQTTDLVEIISSTEFKWLGRADHVINSGGLKISPEQLEKEISVYFERECLIVPEKDEFLGQKLVLVLAGKKDKLLPANILKQLKKLVGKHRTPKTVYFIDSFPRNNSMKIDRTAVIDILKLNI